MIRIIGYILTLLYACALFFPGLFRALPRDLPAVFGHMAFGIFALLIARGARRTSNPFHYFLRLMTTALATGLVKVLADRFAGVYFPENNALFAYVASIALLSGMSMIDGCSHDLVARAITAKSGGDGRTPGEKGDDGKRPSPLFGIPVQPLCYRMNPIVGIAVGLLAIGAALFATLYFRFSHGLYGQAYIVLSFVAFRDAPAPPEKTPPTPCRLKWRRWMERTLFEDFYAFRRALISLAALTAVFLLIATIPGVPKRFMTPATASCLAALPLALLLPEWQDPPTPARRKIDYAMLPVTYTVLLLIRVLI